MQYWKPSKSQRLHLSLPCHTPFYLCSAWWELVLLTSCFFFFVHRADIPGCVPGGAAGGDPECEHGWLEAGVGAAILHYSQKSGHHQGQRLPRQRQEGDPVATLLSESLSHADSIAKTRLRMTFAARQPGPSSHCLNCHTRGILIIYDLFTWAEADVQHYHRHAPETMKVNYEENTRDDLKGGRTEGTHCRSELLRSADQPRRRGHPSTREAVFILDSFIVRLEVPLISCSHSFFPFLLYLYCVDEL